MEDIQNKGSYHIQLAALQTRIPNTSFNPLYPSLSHCSAASNQYISYFFIFSVAVLVSTLPLKIGVPHKIRGHSHQEALG